MKSADLQLRVQFAWWVRPLTRIAAMTPRCVRRAVASLVVGRGIRFEREGGAS